MSGKVVHRWHSNRPNNPEKEVSSTEWNAEHIIQPKSIPLNALDTTGTANNTTVLHGNGEWKVPSGGGTTDKIPVTQIDTTNSPTSTTFLRGDGTWQTPTGGGGTGPSAKMHYQYLIYLDGINATAVDSTGTQIASNTNHATVFQAVINQNPTGIIAIGQGHFDITTSIKLQNDRSYNIVGSGGFIDSGYYPGTVLRNTDGDTTAKIFEIVYSGNYSWSSRIVTLRDLNLRTQKGYGLYCNMVEQGTLPGGMVAPRFNI